MTSQQLLTLQVGTQLRWADIELDAVVAANEPGELRIRWPDGLDSVVTDEDPDVSDFAAALEVVWTPEVEEPTVVARRTGVTAYAV